MGLKWFKDNKQHTIFVLLILLLVFVVLHPYVNSIDHFMNYNRDSDVGNFVVTNQLIIKDSVKEYGQFPFWNIYTLSGTPMFAGPQVGVLGIVTLFSLFLPLSSYAALKLAWLLLYFLAGLGTYILMLNFKLKPRYAFVSALVYMVNGSAGYLFYSYDFWAGKALCCIRVQSSP